MLARTHLVLTLLLVACGDQRTVPDIQDEEREPPDFTTPVPLMDMPPVVLRPVDLGDAAIARQGCEPGPDAPAFRMVAPGLYADPTLGSCGEVAWNDAVARALMFAGVDEEPRQIDETGRARWIGGRRLLYARVDDVVLEETGAPPRRWEASGAHDAAAIRDTGAFWICSAERGVERLDTDGITALTPDFITNMEYSSGCFSIDVSDGGAIAYPTQDYRLGVVDTATGARGVIDTPFFPDGSFDHEERERMDVVRLSPDASFVLHEKRTVELMGDAVGPVGEGEITVATAAEPTANRVPGSLGDPWSFKGSPGWDRRAPWMGSTAGVLLQSWGGFYLVGADATRALELYPLAIRGNHVFAQSRSGAAVLDLTDGRLHELFEAQGLAQALPYRWGGPVAFTHPTGECIRYPDRPDVCHTPIYAVTVWNGVNRARRVALGTYRLHVAAIGPEGQILIAGELLDGPQPETAEPRPVEWREALVRANGSIIRTVDPGTRIAHAVGGARFAVLERHRNDGTKRWSELVRLDWATGDEEVLVAGRFVETWALDHSDSRVTAVVSTEEARQLWTGVVGR